MTPADPFAMRLAQVARSLQAEPGARQTLERAVIAATEMIGDCHLAGISTVHNQSIETVSANGDALEKLDALQYEMREGPCLDALREQETVHSVDLLADPRWPNWGRRVVEETGVRSAVSYRLYISGRTLGAMSLYSRSVEAFDSDDIYHGLALAGHVAVALADAQNAENLEKAITNRTVIGQAEGILMERFDMSADRAFEVLRRISQESNVKLSRVAGQLVATRRLPDELPEVPDRP